MAALDDFFAKKGKKKKKTKATIQSLEETETTASKPEIEQPQPIVVSSSNEVHVTPLSRDFVSPLGFGVAGEYGL